MRYILSFVVVLLFYMVGCINPSYGQQKISPQVQSYLEKVQANNLMEAANAGFKILNTIFLHGSIANDTVPFNFIKKDEKNVIVNLVRGTFLVSGRDISFTLSDSLILNYRQWNVSPNNRIGFTSGGILVTDFLLDIDSAEISVASQQNLAGSPFDISIRNVNIRDIMGLFKKDSLMASGLLNAKIRLAGMDKKLTEFTATATINNFAVLQQPIGNLQLNAQMVDFNTIHTTIELAGNGNEVSAGGDVCLHDGQRQFFALLDIKKMRMATLQGFTKNKVTRASGSINGKIALKGKFKQPEWNGSLNFDSTRFTIAKSGSSYAIEQQKILLGYPFVSFKQFTIKDSLDHSLIVNGNLCSAALKNYDLDIGLISRNFNLVNSPKAINNKFYGYAGMDADVHITGTTAKPIIVGDIYLNENNKVTLVLPEKNIDKDAAVSVVRFIDRDTFALPEQVALKPAEEPKINLEQFLNKQLNIRVGKQAALTIVIDPFTADELNVQGDALLHPGLDSDVNMVLAGNYLLNNGYYELNYQFLKKRFDVIKGSTMYFNGNPTDAQINIRAEYIANTSPKDLLGNEVGSVDPATANSFKKNIPFRVILFLKGSLKKPLISFDIQLPDAGEISIQLRRTIENKLQQLRADIAATNKQVFALLALERFVGEQSTDFFKGNGSDFSDIAKESVSSFLSAALDKIASDLFKGINIDLNLNTYQDFIASEGTEKTDLNVEVSKNFLNDRLSVAVGRNFGIEGQDASSKAAKQKGSRFLPDATVNYKLSTDGKYMIRSYTKDPFQVILDGYVVESGLAFIVTMDYEKFKELFDK